MAGPFPWRSLRAGGGLVCCRAWMRRLPFGGSARGGGGLARAREVARAVEASRRGVRELVAAVFGENAEERKRAAAAESRTRWHMGLVASRVAHTREQRLRAARLMELLMADESNVVRCSAVEGIALLACGESLLRGTADEMIERGCGKGRRRNGAGQERLR